MSSRSGRRMFRGPCGGQFDLSTHEGRLGAIRSLRDRLDNEEYPAALAEARKADPYPVLQFEPGKGVGFFTRAQLRAAIGAEDNNPELCRLLKRESHPGGTVFMVLFWRNEHSYTRTIVQSGEPERN